MDSDSDSDDSDLELEEHSGSVVKFDCTKSDDSHKVMEINGVEICATDNEPYQLLFDKMDDLETISRYLFNIFKLPNLDVWIGWDKKPMDCFIWKLTNSFKNLLISRPDSACNKVTRTEDITFLIENIQVHNDYQLNVFPKDFVYTKPLKFTRIFVPYATWLSFGSLLSSEAESIILNWTPKPMEADLNGFIKKWMEGEFPNLMTLELSWVADEDEDLEKSEREIFQDIQYTACESR